MDNFIAIIYIWNYHLVIYRKVHAVKYWKGKRIHLRKTLSIYKPVFKIQYLRFLNEN
jgi:hypothetical protein